MLTPNHRCSLSLGLLLLLAVVADAGIGLAEWQLSSVPRELGMVSQMPGARDTSYRESLAIVWSLCLNCQVGGGGRVGAGNIILSTISGVTD